MSPTQGWGRRARVNTQHTARHASCRRGRGATLRPPVTQALRPRVCAVVHAAQAAAVDVGVDLSRRE
jgi:hypothetical protein